MITTDVWVTPAQAARLAALYPEVGGEAAAKTKVMEWLFQGHLHATAYEVTRYLYRPPSPEQQPLAQRTDLPLGVQPIGAPISMFDLPLTPEVERGYSLTMEDWRSASSDPDTQWEKIFSDSQLQHRLPAERNPNSYIRYDGLRFASTDIRIRAELAGWEMQAEKLAPPQAIAEPAIVQQPDAIAHSPKGKPMAYDHSFVAALIALRLSETPAPERGTLTGPYVGTLMAEEYATRGPSRKAPHPDTLDDLGAKLLEALRQHWGG